MRKTRRLHHKSATQVDDLMFKISKRKGSSLWQVRKRWPTDVAPILTGEFTRSTGESDRKLAEAKLPIISAEYVALVEDARRRLADNRFRDLSEVEIRRLATEFYTEALRHYQIRGPLDRTQRDELLEVTEKTIETLEDHLARRDPSPVATLTRNMVERTVRSERDPHDLRKYNLELTPKGIEAVAKIIAALG